MYKRKADHSHSLGSFSDGPLRAVLSRPYKMLEFPTVYRLTQRIGRPTTDRYRELIAANLPSSSAKRILELGCGLGAYRNCFPRDYTGIDINSAYVEHARSTIAGRFETMDCTNLRFPDASFDEVVSMAVTHHLDDDQVVKMIGEALRVSDPQGYFHIVDAILPVSGNRTFKTLLFKLDRGRFPRQRTHLLALAREAGNIVHDEVLTGPFHDVAYIRIGRTENNKSV